ncbi:hypothetical protein BGZ72_010717 [Mortierella alpina]|nr:hypothetical protein BGZ72_010717 [Mortierella alpina]
MATFATCPDLHRHPTTRNAGLAAISFCANDNVDDELHGVTPATSYIFGQSQFLKSLSHPALCEYLDVIKGKRDRVFVVQEHYTSSLASIRNAQEQESQGAVSKGQSLAQIRSWAAQILDGLAYLNTHGIVHRSLTLANTLLTDEGLIKLSNYGLFNMTQGGTLVQFSIGDPHYLSPNALGQEYTVGLRDYSVDIWSMGVMLTEMFLGESFWCKERLDLEELIGSLFAIRKLSTTTKTWINDCPEGVGINPVILRFLQTGLTTAEHVKVEDCNGAPSELQDLAKFLRECLSLGDGTTREAAQMRNHVFLKKHDLLESENLSAGLKSKLWHQIPYVQSSFLQEYEGEVERLRQSISQGTLLSDSSVAAPVRYPLLCQLPLPQVFYLWKLAGGDVEAQFRRNGRLVGTPAIQLLPKFVQVVENRDERPPVRDIADLFSDVCCVLPLENLEAEILRSIHEPNKNQFSWDTDYFLFSDPEEMNFLQNTMAEDREQEKSFLYPDSMRPNSAAAKLSSSVSLGTMGKMDSAEETPSLAQQPNKTRVKVPLSIREKDLGYQYQRLSMFTDLLLQHPASRAEILHHSKIDIPPLLRGKVWAAILGVVGDYQRVYEEYDKYTEKSTDRQIELGLDSCCAPFLTLNFNDEALAFACIQKFLPKFLKDMFLHDNSQVIHEYLAVFRHLLSYHDPELSSHLDHIRFIPQLYAISWFMTLFTHIFPLDKIYHLWDKILVGPSSLPLFVGIAILQQFRQQLLQSEFNEAIGIFSESFPEMDIEKCIETALAMCRVTPPSTCWLSYDQESREMRKQLSSASGGNCYGRSGAGSGPAPMNAEGNGSNGNSSGSTAATEAAHHGRASMEQQEPRRSKEIDFEKRLSSQGAGGNVVHWWEEPLSIEVMNTELAPRIHRSDFVRLRQQAMVLDIRSEAEFRNGHYPLSIHMVASQLDLLLLILKKLKKSYLVVIANRGDSGSEFASALVSAGFNKVALLMGGVDALRIAEPMTTSSTSSTANATGADGSARSTATSQAGMPSTVVVTPTICSCRVIRQVISVHVKVKEEVVVHKCKTPFTLKKLRSSAQ